MKNKQSHGKKHYKKNPPQPESSMNTLVDLVDMIDQLEGLDRINTILFSISIAQLLVLQELALE